MRCFIIFFVVCISILLPVKMTQGWEGDSEDSWILRKNTFSKHTQEMLWRLQTYQNLSHYNSIWLESEIIMHCNAGQSPFFLTDQSSPTLTIWRSDQPRQRQTKVLSNPLAFHEYTLRRQTTTSQSICSFKVDIRNIFGKLAPGKYFLKVEWAIKGRFINETKPKKLLLQSSNASFTVHKVSPVDLKKIALQHEKKKRTTKYLRYKLLQPLGTGVEVTNHSKSPIYFRYEQIHRKLGCIDILAVYPARHLWDPKLGWRDLGTKAPVKGSPSTYTLRPSKSVQLRAMQSSYDGDGIYYDGYKCVEKITKNPYVSGKDFETSIFVIQGSTGFSAKKNKDSKNKNIKENKKK